MANKYPVEELPPDEAEDVGDSGAEFTTDEPADREYFTPTDASIRTDAALADFLDSLKNPRTQDAYQRRLREIFLDCGIFYVGQLTENCYLAYTDDAFADLFTPQGSRGKQARAALQKFLIWAVLRGYQNSGDLDDLVLERISDVMNLRSIPEPSAQTLALRATDRGAGLAARDAFLAALVEAGLGRYFEGIRVDDLLTDIANLHWLVVDLPERRRRAENIDRVRRPISGALLFGVTPGMYHQATTGHRLLRRSPEEPSLFLGARGEPISTAAVRARLRKRGQPEQQALLEETVPVMPVATVPSRFPGWVSKCVSSRGMSFAELARRTRVEKRYWWRLVDRRSQKPPTSPPPGVVARFAVAVGTKVTTTLVAAGYDPGDIPEVR